MVKPYSDDLRERVVGFVLAGGTVRQAAGGRGDSFRSRNVRAPLSMVRGLCSLSSALPSAWE